MVTKNNGVIRITPQDAAWVAATALLLAGYLFLAASANFDLADGRFALHMDERITFDGVQRILYPESLAGLLQSILDGGDHRYGRILWNTMAAASLLPAYVFGDAGQIIASRMLQVGLLSVAFIVLAQTFVKNRWLKLVFLAALLSMPYTDYYMTMPKPEPLQVLFLAIFLYFYKKGGLSFGRHWIFLGLAFGTKISTLPALVVFTAVSFLHGRTNKSPDSGRGRFWQAVNYFFLGLALAAPVLVIPILALFLFQWVGNRRRLKKKYKIPAILVSTFLLIIGLGKIETWLSATFLNTKHGADQESINFGSWAEYFVDSWLVAPAWLGGALVAVCGLFLAYWSFCHYRNKQRPPPVGLAVALAGVMLNLAIFISAHRLWGFYLYPGSVLLLTGLFSLVDASIAQARVESSTAISGVLMAAGLTATVTAITVFYWAPHGLASFRELSVRTESTEYRLELASYRKVVSRLDELSQTKNKRLDVAFDPILFLPSSSSGYRVVEFWGPYTNWDKDADVLVFSAVHTLHGSDCQQGSDLYQACLAERDGYSRFVIGGNERCRQEKCYRRQAELPNGGEMLVLEREDSPPALVQYDNKERK